MPITTLRLFIGGGYMSKKRDPQKIKKMPLIVMSIGAFIVVATCAYYGYNIGGLGGAAVGVFFGLAITGC